MEVSNHLPEVLKLLLKVLNVLVGFTDTLGV
jgi:hypothetical protein